MTEPAVVVLQWYDLCCHILQSVEDIVHIPQRIKVRTVSWHAAEEVAAFRH
jgi:hypothetical protein